MAAHYFCPSALMEMEGRHLSVSLSMSVSVLGHHNGGKRINFSSASTQFRKCRAVCVKSNAHRCHGKILSSKVQAQAGGRDGDGDGAADLAATKGRQLWRSELESASELSSESLDGATLERDIERFAKKEEMEKLWSQADRSEKNQAPDGRGGIVRDVVDKILVADFFFILFILAWLLAGLAEQGALESTKLIDSWLPLWPLVFQPALGVFMAGAIVSAITRKQ